MAPQPTVQGDVRGALCLWVVRRMRAGEAKNIRKLLGQAGQQHGAFAGVWAHDHDRFEEDLLNAARQQQARAAGD